MRRSLAVDQAAVTVIARVKPDSLAELRALLERMGEDPAGNDLLPFGQLRGVHFGRFVLLEPSRDLNGQAIPPSLVFHTDVDGSTDRYLRAVVELAGEGLDRIYSHCDSYPPDGARTRESRLAYLRARLNPASAIYINTRGRSVAQVRQEAELREAIQGYLDRTWPGWAGADPRVVRGAVRDFVARDPSLRWARRPVWRGLIVPRLREPLHLAGGVLALLCLLPFALLALPVWLVLLRYHELTDVPERVRPTDERWQQLASLEDHVVQNQFSAIGFVKPQPFRQLTARLVLALANFVVRHFFNRANLAGVKTIHFAQWIFVDDGRRVLFHSNYDGTLESYMDDFINIVAWGLNAVFSNGVGYPRTNWLMKDGANDEGAFKDYLRNRQIPTQVWYSAYPGLTALNIDNNARIREGLSGRMGLAEATAWVRRL
jgi:hypothetical protein